MSYPSKKGLWPIEGKNASVPALGYTELTWVVALGHNTSSHTWSEAATSKKTNIHPSRNTGLIPGVG